MGGPAWLAWTFAGVTLATALYCVARLLAAWRQRRPTDQHADAIHMLMGVAMAGMLIPRLRVFWVGGWEVVFGAGTVWFAWLALREYRGRTATGGRTGHHLQHVLACGAMLYMFLAAATIAKASAGAAARSGMAGGAAPFRTLALVLAFALVGYVVWNADRLSSVPPAPARPAPARPAPARPAPAGQGQSVPLSPRLAACCEIAMGISMGYMLILML